MFVGVYLSHIITPCQRNKSKAYMIINLTTICLSMYIYSYMFTYSYIFIGHIRNFNELFIRQLLKNFNGIIIMNRILFTQ